MWGDAILIASSFVSRFVFCDRNHIPRAHAYATPSLNNNAIFSTEINNEAANFLHSCNKKPKQPIFLFIFFYVCAALCVVLNWFFCSFLLHNESTYWCSPLDTGVALANESIIFRLFCNVLLPEYIQKTKEHSDSLPFSIRSFCTVKRSNKSSYWRFVDLTLSKSMTFSGSI